MKVATSKLLGADRSAINLCWQDHFRNYGDYIEAPNFDPYFNMRINLNDTYFTLIYI